jgi:hypothetical protein
MLCFLLDILLHPEDLGGVLLLMPVDRITSGAENPHRMQLPGCIFKWQKRWERCICTEEHYFEVDGGQYAQS